MAEANEGKAKSKGGGMIKLLFVLLFVAAVGGGGAWFYLTQVAVATDVDPDAPKPAAKKAEAVYWPFAPSFVVNLPDGAYMRYLKLDLELMTRDPALVATLEKHAPLLRDRLLLLFSGGDYQTLLGREGKLELQAAALSEINRELASVGAAGDAVEALYFTNFVMQ